MRRDLGFVRSVLFGKSDLDSGCVYKEERLHPFWLKTVCEHRLSKACFPIPALTSSEICRILLC